MFKIVINKGIFSRIALKVCQWIIGFQKVWTLNIYKILIKSSKKVSFLKD